METRDKKILQALESCQKTLNKLKLNIPELILFYGNLGYRLGAAIAGIHGGSGPDTEELQKAYYQNPTVDVGLMLQGLLINTWEENFRAKPQISRIGEKYNPEKEKENENDS